MVLEGVYDALIGAALVYVRGYNLVSDFSVLFNNTLVFGAEFVIKNWEVDLVALQSEAVHYGVVG